MAMRLSFGANLPQSVTYIYQKANFKHALAKLYFRPEKTGSANKKSITDKYYTVNYQHH